MRDFWRRHAWQPNERRYHWLVVFDQDEAVRECYAAHAPILERHRGVIEPVPAEWLHMTLQQLCVTSEAKDEELERLAADGARQLADLTPPRVELGPARIDGAAVTWAVYPEEELVEVQSRIAAASTEVLGTERVPQRRSRWWPHVTLGYGTVEGDPADDLAAELARAGLPRVPVTVTSVALVDEEQDLHQRQYRWRTLARVPVGAG